jgi:MSHA biogenesis protein MshL
MNNAKFALCTVLAAMLLAGCAAPASQHESYDLIRANIKADIGTPSQPDAVSRALLPPLEAILPKAREPLEPRFSVNFNQVAAGQFFSAIVVGTRFSALLDPEVAGLISANLKDVTLFEALDAVRDLYGYDYVVEGTKIYIRPLTMQTRMYHVNYLTGSRKGNSSLRVTSTSITNSGSGQGGQGNQGNQGNQNNQGGGGSVQDSTVVSTTSASDFWIELKKSLEDIIGIGAGGKDGRSVVISPQSGVLVIRALPKDLRNVALFLKATQISVDRQVILEAKILEVQLNDAYQTGINWAAFTTVNGLPLSLGMVSPSAALTPRINGVATAQSSAGNASITATAGSALSAAAGAGGSLFGLAFQTGSFSTLISFLESQGSVHVLSSPRIATMNNQKAVLKIGTDEFYVTGVSTSTVATGTSSVTSPNVTLQPFFSGVVLDVTPQIDSHGNIILHVHPSVSQVSTVNKAVNLGNAGSLSLPLAASSTSEMDSIVRGQNGRIIALGGLMRQASSGDRSQIPLIGDMAGLGGLFRNTANQTQKRELVVLIKPTIVDEESGVEDLRAVERRMGALQPRRAEERE